MPLALINAQETPWVIEPSIVERFLLGRRPALRLWRHCNSRPLLSQPEGSERIINMALRLPRKGARRRQAIRLMDLRV
jgi:hypothetical protein